MFQAEIIIGRNTAKLSKTVNRGAQALSKQRDESPNSRKDKFGYYDKKTKTFIKLI